MQHSPVHHAHCLDTEDEHDAPSDHALSLVSSSMNSSDGGCNSEIYFLRSMREAVGRRMSLWTT